MSKPDILPDVLEQGLGIVFCGTAASRISAKLGYNYANPGNQFWPTLKLLGLVPADFDPIHFRTLPQYGLGLTDLCKASIGNDDELSDESYDTAALMRKIKKYQPRILAFTSKNGASHFIGGKPHYGLQDGTIGHTKLFVLPSTSGRARRFFDISVWRALGALHLNKFS